MAHPAFVKMTDRGVAPDTDDLAGWTKITGDPSMKTWVDYTSEDGTLVAGRWAATPGVYHATYSTWEYVHLIEGRIKITPDGGETHEVGPGDAFVVEADFAGTWEIIEEVFKHFVVRI